MAMNDNLTRAKASAISAVMKNPKLSKLIFSAWKAPVGSTKNSQVKSILSSLTKASSNYNRQDGQGGAFDSYFTPSTQPRTSTSSGYSDPLLKYFENAYTPPNYSPKTPMSVMSPDQKSAITNPQKEITKTLTGGMTPLGGATVSDAPSTTKFIRSADELLASYGVDTDSLSKTMQDILDSSGENGLDTWYSGLGVDEQTRMKDVYDAVKSGVGPKTFKMGVLSDRDSLAKLLNLPPEAVSNLPESGLLSDQLNELEDAIRTEFKLDSQYENLTNLQNQGLGLETNLTSYIKGKDEYLGKIDKLLDEGKSKIAYMDTSDPKVSKRMSNYLNYLTILSGRQTNRYIDFLNMGIESFNNKMTQATNIYNSNLAAAESAIKRQTAITKEAYQNVSDMLEELYENVDNRTKISQDQTKYQLDILNSALLAAGRIVAINEDANDIVTADDKKKMTRAEKEAEMNKSLAAVRGVNKFVSPDDWNKFRNEWTTLYNESPNDFDTTFAGYRNPNNPYYTTVKEAPKTEDDVAIQKTLAEQFYRDQLVDAKSRGATIKDVWNDLYGDDDSKSYLGPGPKDWELKIFKEVFGDFWGDKPGLG